MQEAEDAYLYIARDAPEAAVLWFNGLVDAIYSLEDLPGRCLPAPEAEEAGREIRQLLYGKRSGRYRILFVITSDDVVKVLHIRHAARENLASGEIDF